MKKRLYTRGFTLAEILITLVIIGFVASLGIPMLGQQKVKKPVETMDKHGTVECFYIGSQLYQYTADNVDNKYGTLTPVSGACYFTTPVASRFIFQVVGAGGNGGAVSPSYLPATTNQNGTISTGTAFATQLKNAPEWVQNEWDTQWNGHQDVTPTYTITSPVAASGNGACDPRRDDYKLGYFNENCQYTCAYDLSTCDPDCLIEVSAKGGNSGVGGMVTVEAPVYANNNIRFIRNAEYGQLDFGDGRYVKLTLPANAEGEDGKVVHGTPIHGSDGENFSPANIEIAGAGINLKSISTIANRQGGSGCGDKDGETALRGSAAGGDSISYQTQALAVKATFGLAGSAGDNTVKIYENIPSGTAMRFIPAANTSQNSIVQVQNESGSWSSASFIVANSGSDGITYNNRVLPMSNGDMPFPKQYYPDSFKGVTPTLTVSNGNGYVSHLAQLINAGNVPGASGSGAFPIISHLEGNAQHFINGVSTGSETLPPMDASGISAVCPNGGSSTTACYASNGNPGAIVVTW